MGARFAYLLDAAALEGCHWTNEGGLEDVATGSGAGCAAAYLRRHNRIGDGETVPLHQDASPAAPAGWQLAHTVKGWTSTRSWWAARWRSLLKGT
ncbi:hypothetical protein CTU88_29340 [Streptomyces sp. JV178]|uniref:hypothetical protein n=1 Tax=Streptomyces sp. JV178 TaxID=858632 RepID=UPI000C1B22CA|nr:hypothetical protein [Streptomyces sp. JV178]PIM68980.1 hypothetical protein CTU88_29340 [Streptomyces sp. JV178]